MPVQEGWEIVKDALERAGGAGKFDYEPFKSILPAAVDRAKEMAFRQPKCELEYVGSGSPAPELAWWEISLMFVEYVAGMLLDKARNHCYTHPTPCELSSELHHQMLKNYVADLEKLTNEIRKLLPLEPGKERIIGA